MQSNDEILERIAGLQRSSRIAIPLGMIAFAMVMGMLYFSSQELLNKRNEIERIDKELQEKRGELKEVKKTMRVVQAQIEEASKKIEEISSSSKQNTSAGKAQDAIERLAAADASLSAAQYNIAVPTAQNDIAAPIPAPFFGEYGLTRVDVFYCEERGISAKTMAERLLALKGESRGRWRARFLSKAANDSSGYGLTVNVIRHNADERELAIRLQQQAQQKVGAEFVLQQIAYPTPNYISVFVCGDRKG